MTDKLLWYPWFPRDFQADEHVQLMDLAEEGAYRRLLDHQWLHGSIPADPALLCRLVNAPEQRWGTMWVALGPCFHPVEGDPSRLANRKLERIRGEQLAKRAKRQAAGSEGGKQKASNATARGKQKPTDTDAEGEEEAENSNSPPPAEQGPKVTVITAEDLEQVPAGELEAVMHLIRCLPPSYGPNAVAFFVWLAGKAPEGPQRRLLFRTTLATIEGAARGLAMPGGRPASWEAIAAALVDIPNAQPPVAEVSPKVLRGFMRGHGIPAGKGPSHRAQLNDDAQRRFNDGQS